MDKKDYSPVNLDMAHIYLTHALQVCQDEGMIGDIRAAQGKVDKIKRNLRNLREGRDEEDDGK